MTPATPRQLALLRYVAGAIEANHGISPSFREMMRDTGITALSSIRHDLTTLEKRGLIRRIANRARAIEVLHPPVIPRSPTGEPLFYVEAK